MNGRPDWDGPDVRRRLHNLVTLLSLLLCLGSGLLWARSHRRVQDYVAWRGRTTLLAESKAGRLWLECWREATPVPVRPGFTDVNWALLGAVNSATGAPTEIGYTPPEKSLSNGYGFVWHASDLSRWSDGKQPGTLHALAVPWWSITAASALPPLAWMMKRLRRRSRRAAGQCPTCGYDLRATPGRCPECGVEW
jgi:hypothetical protein